MEKMRFNTKLRTMDWRSIFLSLILALAVGTILTIIIGQFGAPVLALGKAWIIVFISIFIVYYFIAAADKKIDRSEISIMLFIAILFFAMGFIMKRFIPEIFAALPSPTKTLMSAIGV
jgi:hypothetical protein